MNELGIGNCLINYCYWKGSLDASYSECHRKHHKNRSKKEYDMQKVAKIYEKSK